MKSLPGSVGQWIRNRIPSSWIASTCSSNRTSSGKVVHSSRGRAQIDVRLVPLKTECPVDPATREWIDDQWTWFEEEFGLERLRKIRVILPQAEFFPLKVYRKSTRPPTTVDDT